MNCLPGLHVRAEAFPRSHELHPEQLNNKDNTDDTDNGKQDKQGDRCSWSHGSGVGQRLLGGRATVSASSPMGSSPGSPSGSANPQSITASSMSWPPNTTRS